MQNPKTPASSEDSSSKIHDVPLSLLCYYYYHRCQICTARCGNARGRDEAGGNLSRFFPYLEQPDIDSCLKYAGLTRRIAKSLCASEACRRGESFATPVWLVEISRHEAEHLLEFHLLAAALAVLNHTKARRTQSIDQG